ncbi:MAG: universal stress protein [Treponemataceae bacterium]|nr:universal stress protein [Treponemataceae bacterium]
MIKPLFQKVLIVVNGSEASIKAAEYGILMAKLYKCSLKAVYVVDTATLKQLTLSKLFVAEESREYEQNLQADGTRYLEYVKSLALKKNINIETELRRGSVWTEVCTAADEMDANVILLGGMAATGSDGRDVLTEAYREILLNARCSVLMVREKMIEQLYKMA